MHILEFKGRSRKNEHQAERNNIRNDSPDHKKQQAEQENEKSSREHHRPR